MSLGLRIAKLLKNGKKSHMKSRKYIRISTLVVVGLALTLVPRSLLADDFDELFACKSGSNIGSGELEAKSLIKKVQNAYNGVDGLRSSFRQKSSLLGMPESFNSRGSLMFLRPGKMNWKYEAPKVQSFVSDGETVWYYEPEVNQVTVGKLSQSFDTQVPVSFLLGVGKIDESFDPVSRCKVKGYELLNLKPKGKQGNLKSFSLLVDGKTYLPAGAKMLDSSDTSTEFLFSELKVDNSISPEEFSFTPPEGVDIVKH